MNNINNTDIKYIKNLDFDYIKKMFCKFNCPIDKIEVNIDVVDSFLCDDCQEYKDMSIETTATLDKGTICQVCQVDNFIRELQNNN